MLERRMPNRNSSRQPHTREKVRPDLRGDGAPDEKVVNGLLGVFVENTYTLVWKTTTLKAIRRPAIAMDC